MKFLFFRPWSLLTAALVASFLSHSTFARADSGWQDDLYSSLRLIAGSDASDTGTRLAGIEIKLHAGWKTYWRVPGDSGIPPQFDFSGSDNVKTATVLWPAPHAFPDGAGGQSIGYHDHVIFPVRVTPVDANRPVVLKAFVQYAACQKLCVPAQGRAQVALGNTGGASRVDLQAALREVPKQIEPGATSVIRRVTRDAANKRILIDIVPPAEPATLFVEGPTPEWAFPLPKKIESPDPNVQRYAVALEGAPPGASYDNLALRVTLSAGADSVETALTLN